MKILQAGVIYAVSNVASAAVPFLLLPLLTRMLSPADYGHVVVFAMLTSLCMPFAGLSAHAGLGAAWFNRPRDEMPGFIGAALMLVAVTTLITALVVTFVLLLGRSWTSEISPLWGAVAAVTAGANVLLQCRLVLWQSQGHPFRNASLQITSSILNISLSLFAVLTLGLGAAGRNAGIATSGIVIAIAVTVAFFAAREAVWAHGLRHMRELVRYGLPLIPHVLAGVFIATVDRWTVSAQLGAEALGVYGAGAQLGMSMTILADAFVKAYNPWLYSRMASTEPSDKFRVIGAVCVTIPIFFCAATVVGICLALSGGLFLGPKYESALLLLPWFMLGGALSGVYFSISSMYFYAGRTGLLATATLSAAICGSLLIVLLVGRFGVQGAAMGYACTQGFIALFSIIVAMRTFDLPWSQPRQSVRTLLRFSFRWRKARMNSQLKRVS